MKSFVDGTGILRCGLALAPVAWLVLSAAAAFGGQAEEYLQSQAEVLIDYAIRHNWKTVGVLKFRVYENMTRPNDTAGTLNGQLADVLEASIKTANEARKSQIRIVWGASSRAARIRGANHLTPRGRKRLFEYEYPLYAPDEASGAKQSKVDGFFTGVVILSRDERDLRIQLIGFDETDRGLDDVTPGKTLPVDDDLRVARGEDFQTRSLPAEPEAEESAVNLDIYYDDVLQDIEEDERTGQYYVREPKEGQKVYFRLYAKGVSEPLAAVVKVNGQNTWYREQLPAQLCTKWSLEPGAAEIKIEGYLKDDDENYEEFKVSSPPVSRMREVYYGDEVGLISVTVFQERNAAQLPKAKMIPEDLKLALQFLDKQRQEELGIQTRGLLEPGKVRSCKVREVPFKTDPTPILNRTIRYYNPQ